MKRLYVLCFLIFSCSGLFSQSRIDNFYSLITSSNVCRKSEIWTFVKTENNVLSTKENKRLSSAHEFNDYWRKAGVQIDSLNSIDYKCDTLFIFQSYEGVKPYNPFTMIISKNDWIVIGYGSVKHLNDVNGWPFYYDYFHPISINTIVTWDIFKIEDLIARFGTRSGELEGPIWITVDRVIINEYKKIDTSIIRFDGMSFFSLRDTNNILY